MTSEAAPSEGRGFWPWLRFGAVLLLSAVMFLIGIRLLPGKPLKDNITQPTIAVYSYQPGVNSALSMTMIPEFVPARLVPEPFPTLPNPRSSAPGSPSRETSVPPAPPPPPPGQGRQAPGYELFFTLKILGRVTKPLTFVMILNDFPPVTGMGLVPLSLVPVRKSPGSAAASAAPGAPPPPPPVIGDLAPGRKAYLALFTVRPGDPSPVRGVKRALTAAYLDVTTLRPLVAANAGSELRITFPLVEGAGLTSSLPTATSELFANVKNLPPLPQQLYQPDIEPATTEYVASQGENLSDFQTLAGDPPATVRDSWFWGGVSDVTLLAQNVMAADQAQRHLFEAGILLGVAATGAIALPLEAIGIWQESETRRRKRAEKTRQQASRAAQIG
jgi:hypothetical protein